MKNTILANLKRTIKALRWLSIIYTIIGLIGLFYLLTSCSVVNKVFHKNKSRIDSTSVTHERKDSVVTEDQFTIHKSQNDSDNELIVEIDRDSGLITPINPNKPDDYFDFNVKTGELKTNMPVKKVTLKGNQSVFNYDSLVNHSKIELSELKDDSVRLKSVQKETVKEVHKKRTWWWLLLLIPLYIAYRNRDKIKAIVIHLFTGL